MIETTSSQYTGISQVNKLSLCANAHSLNTRSRVILNLLVLKHKTQVRQRSIKYMAQYTTYFTNKNTCLQFVLDSFLEKQNKN